MRVVELNRRNTYTSQSSVNRYRVEAMQARIKSAGISWFSETDEQLLVSKNEDSYLVINGHKRIRAALEEFDEVRLEAEVEESKFSPEGRELLINIRKTLY